LVNQGWKDSPDALRFADGSRAVPPVALCEMQGYAHEAARCGAALLDAFGLAGGEGWRQWADRLAVAFRRRFWVAGDYPAVALDSARRPVDTVTSNIGHLLGTGLLDAAETERVAARLGTLDSGYGIRTLSATASSYDPMSYHRGSVWPHDTAIALLGLSRSGQGDRAAPLVEGLLRAGERFGYRLPELYAGDADGLVPYPAACRPQAWSAAAGVAVLTVLLGLAADVPNGRLAVRPLRPLPTGALTVEGLAAGGHRIDIGVDAAGAVTGVAAGGLAVDSGS
jgi:glycogen debranching enzyme